MAYTWEGMVKITKSEAIEMFKNGQEVYRLYDDNTEGLVESLDDILDERFLDYDFGYERGWEVLGYYVHKDNLDNIQASTVEVVIKDDLEFEHSGRLTIYCPIGQHATGTVEWFEECVPITKEQYLHASRGFYTPEEYL